ncbi:alpha/beta hydrolase [Streptomyces sp. TLI_171]|uniref:alpha/beta hydrolase n=1 Tax=Streptomyces sp. TLI_171 TaxID=1938859 RepID=UPI00117D3E42|nr:alpha/beta hydrolase [Streptomyces sp. TLI_171]
MHVIAGATPPARIVFLFPGGGLNVLANFCTAARRSLAEVLVERGCLVVGVDPREDGVDPADPDPACARWGLAAHRADADRVVAGVVAAVGLPYEVLGHSAGAAVALDLAAYRAWDVRLERVLVLDTTGPYDAEVEPELVERARGLASAMRELLAAGTTTVDPGLRGLFARAVADPDGDSPVPRPAAAGGGFVSNRGLVHLALTRTAELPGAANWVYHHGLSSGDYEFGAARELDRFRLDRSPFEVWAAAVRELGSGVQPVALLRDLAAVWGGWAEVYGIDWSAVRAEVVWVNAEGGRGDHDLGARRLAEAGASVDYRVVPGYGHGDVVWAVDAEQQVWRRLLSRRG